MGRISQVFTAVLLLALSIVGLEAKQTTYTFGVVPQQTAVRMAKTWVPFTTYLKQKTGYDFRFVTAKNIPAYRAALADSKYDFGYMNPLQYTTNSGQGHYQAFARARDKKIRGVIVTRKDGTINKLKDLHQQKLAFPSKVAFGATMVVMADLQFHGINVDPVYVESHDSVYQNIAKGNVVAGGGVKRTFAALPEPLRNQLTILHTTNGYTPHAIAAHARVPVGVVLKVQQALIGMEDDPVGRDLLTQLKIKGIVAATDNEWNDVRHDFPQEKPKDR